MRRILFLTLMSSPIAHAATLTVDTTEDIRSDDSVCSLRDAITAANDDSATRGCQAGSGADTIVIPAGTYEVTEGRMDISTDIALQGDGMDQTVLDAQGLSSLFFVSADSEAFSMSGLTLSGASGGAMRIKAAGASVQDCAFRNNAGNVGAGVYFDSAGTVSVSSSVFVDNTASTSGGGLAMKDTESITLDHLYIAGNSAPLGGGIMQYGSSDASLSNTTLAYNDATSTGGAMYLNSASTLLGDHLSVVGNTSEGSPVVNFYLVATNSVFADHDGCGGTITADNSVSDQATGCTFDGTGNLNDVDVLLDALVDNGDHTSGFATLWGSPANGLSDCTDGDGAAVLEDQTGATRPSTDCTA